jgi:signal transduction histidine kinase
LFIPLLLLTALGIRGISASRRGALESAKTDASRALEYATHLFEGDVAALRSSVRTVALYALVPKPTDTPQAEALYERAVAASPEEAEPIFSTLLSEFPAAVSSAGLPLAPLVEWMRLANCQNPGEFATRLESLGRTATRSFPSILTPEFLRRAEVLAAQRGIATDRLTEWQRQWMEDEAVREWLQREKIEDGKPFARWLTADAQSVWLESQGDQWLLLPEGDLRVAAEHAAAATLLPGSCEITIEWGQRDLRPSKNGAEILARKVSGPLSIAAILVDPNALYRQQRWQTFWLAALLAVALLAVLGAFFVMQRTLASERQLNQQKSDFVASVSHELRAPVASMRLMLENLESGAVASETARHDYLHLLEGECRRLSTLIENVLDFARIEHNRKIYHMAETDVAALVKDATDLLQPRAAQRRQEIRGEVHPLDAVPCIDALAIQQALINLIDNASKFSPEATIITVIVAPRDAQTWQLSVADQGPGVAECERDRIFDRFYRIGGELRRETQGSGIGLSIVKHTVMAHAGSIELDSQPGAGARFTLILPYSCGHRDDVTNTAGESLANFHRAQSG